MYSVGDSPHSRPKLVASLKSNPTRYLTREFPRNAGRHPGTDPGDDPDANIVPLSGLDVRVDHLTISFRTGI